MSHPSPSSPSQHRAPANFMATRATEQGAVLGFVDVQAVVQEELLASADVAQRIEGNNQSAALICLLVRNAVGHTGMVQVTSSVATVGRIDHRAVGEPEDVGQATVPVAAPRLMSG